MGSELFNFREKSFPDGLKQSTFFEKYRYKGKRKNSGGPAAHGSGLSVERKEYENMKRAIQMVWDLGRSNVWEWWITLTLSPEFVDRSDYKACSKEVCRFTKYLGSIGCRYLLVPDWDSGDGVHFHGLLSGPLKFVRACSPYTGKPLFDKNKRPCYNIPAYKFGFTSAVPLDGSPAVVTYLTQYYTKNRKNRKMEVPKGCKRYWASRNLNRPEISYDLVALETFLKERFVVSNYTKEIESRFGDMILTETTEEDIMAYLEQLGRKEDSGTGPTQQNKDYVEVSVDAASPF